MTTRHIIADSILGPVTIIARGAAVTGLYFAQHIRRPDRATFGPAVAIEADLLLAEADGQLTDHLAGRRRDFDLPFAPEGDAFQRRVWARIARIPYGATTTYGAIAAQLGDRSLAQQVGQAAGANPLCVFVPCHRVVGADGRLTGYAGGLDRKRRLLALEEPTPAEAGRLL